ncbi:MAG: HAMP domain-containing protein [Gammaproteobacteria bacterium]|nr:HAMP domain-containing protein [Gammaproteobacteria bacterium]MYI23606.1 HAMP domain-containing protein [Gammaproteobacteria bacterium]
MTPPVQEGLDSRIHSTFEWVLAKLPSRWGAKLRDATGNRFGIASQIWVGLGGGVSLTLVASLLALGLMTIVNASQREVTGTYMPGMIAAFDVARSSSELVRASPRLIAADTPEDLALVEGDVMREEEFLLTRLGEMTGAGIEGELQDSVVRLASTLVESIDLIRESVSRRMNYRAQVSDLEREVQEVTLGAELLLVAEIDDQEFFMATGLRELTDQPAPVSARNAPTELDHYRGLLEYQSTQNEVSLLIQRGLTQDDPGLLQTNRERVTAAMSGLEAALDALNPETAALFRPSFQALGDLYSAANGIFTIRTLELAELAESEEYLALNETTTNDLNAFVQPLVENAEISTQEAADRSATLLQIGWWTILAVNVLAVLAAVFGGWKFFGERLLVRLRHLSDVMRRMSRGELEAKLEIAGNDEVTDMAGALEVFRQHAIEVQRLNLVEALATEVQDKNAELESTLDELRRTQEQVITQEKLASLGALTAGVAHEIRNPLNFVNNFAALSVELIDELREELGMEGESGNGDGAGPLAAGGDEELTEIVDEILGDLQLNISKVKEHGDRANRIVDGMLAHSRDEAGQIESIDINLLVEEYTKLAYHGMRGTDATFNVTIIRELDPEAGRVDGIARDLSRVILNIVTNACQATQMRGKAEGRGYSPTLLVSTEGRSDAVCIKVRDNGTGMPESVVRKIFDPFFTTKSGTQGTGLGLSISHEIVREHEGQLAVETEEGEFTEFTIILPRMKGK